MSRWFPHPLFALALLAIWLLLTQTFSLSQVLLGGIATWLAGQALAALRPSRIGPVRLRASLKLAIAVAMDIVRSNLAVAGIILSRRGGRTPGFVRVPLDLTNRQALAVLALIVTATPGTLWVEFDHRKAVLLLHVLDLVDHDEWVRLIKERYEPRLQEIFGR